MGVADKLGAARELLERAQRAPEGEALWLVTLAWSQLQEVAETLEATRRGGGAQGANRDAVLALAAR